MKRARSLSMVALLSCTALVACDKDYIANRDPQFSDIVLDGNTMPEASRIQVPMPASQPAPRKFGSERASLWGHTNATLYSDQRATGVGDILTINIAINDQASLSNATNRTRGGSSTLGAPVIAGATTDDLPFVDNAGGNFVDLTANTQGSGSGSIDRNESINLKVAAIIMQRLPNGNFVVAGRQEVRVNKELRELRVTGIIRPQDVAIDNSVAYEKIAEARISYGGRGQISALQDRGWGEDVMDVVLPY